VITTLGYLAYICNVRSGAKIAELRGHETEIRSAKFSPDGTRIATTDFAPVHTVRLWDANSFASLAVLRAEPEENLGMDAFFSPDSERLVTYSAARAKLWYGKTGEFIGRLDGHWEIIKSIAFSSDGKRLATASEDGTARIWESVTSAPIATLKGHNRGLNAIAFSPDGRRIVTASNDKTARVWDFEVPETLLMSGNSAVVSPDGSRVVTTSGPVARLRDHNGILIALLDGHEVGSDPLFSASEIEAVFSPDSNRILTRLDDDPRLWDAQTGKLVAVLRGHQSKISGAQFSLDGSRIVSASRDGTARVWDGETGKLISNLQGHTKGLLRAELSPDNTRVLSLSSDKTARVWNTATGVWRTYSLSRESLYAI